MYVISAKLNVNSSIGATKWKETCLSNEILFVQMIYYLITCGLHQGWIQSPYCATFSIEWKGEEYNENKLNRVVEDIDELNKLLNEVFSDVFIYFRLSFMAINIILLLYYLCRSYDDLRDAVLLL